MKKRNLQHIVAALKVDMRVRYNFKNVSGITYTFMAEKLKIDAKNFTTARSRGSIPYELILEYCANEMINPLHIFYDTKE